MDFSSISALGASPMTYLAASSPTASTDSSSSSTDASSIGPAATLEISTLRLQGQMVSTLLAGLSGGNPTGLFAGLGGGHPGTLGSTIDLLA